MRLVSWNIENAVRHLTALPSILEQLRNPDVLCLQELRIRHHDAEAIRTLEAALPVLSVNPWISRT